MGATSAPRPSHVQDQQRKPGPRGVAGRGAELPRGFQPAVQFGIPPAVGQHLATNRAGAVRVAKTVAGQRRRTQHLAHRTRLQQLVAGDQRDDRQRVS